MLAAPASLEGRSASLECTDVPVQGCSSEVPLDPVLVWQEHGQYVRVLAQRFLGSREGAEDIAQEVYILLQQKGSTIHHSAAIRSWLSKVTYSVAMDAMRRERFRRKNISLDALGPAGAVDEHTPDQRAQERECCDAVQRVLEELSPSDRKILRARFVEGLSYTELQACLGKRRIGTIRSGLSNAKRRFRARFEQLAPDLVPGGNRRSTPLRGDQPRAGRRAHRG